MTQIQSFNFYGKLKQIVFVCPCLILQKKKKKKEKSKHTKKKNPSVSKVLDIHQQLET